MKKIFTVIAIILPIFAHSQVSENFETGKIDKWTQFPENKWSISNENALEGFFSLKHANNVYEAGNDRISIPVENIDVSAGTTIWRFMLKHGYNPSSKNYWTIYLMSNKNAEYMTTDSIANAYAIGVNLTNGDDTLKLYKINGKTISTIITTKINWEKDIKTNGIAALEIQRSANGKWNVKIGRNGNFNNLEDTGNSATNNDFNNFAQFGISYKYTATAAKKLWFDNLSITSSKFPAQILNVEKTGKTKISAIMSKKIKSVENVILTDNNGENVRIKTFGTNAQDSSKIDIETNRLIGRKFTLKLQNIVDENEIKTSPEKEFFIDNFCYGDIVFNEIMFKSDPEKGLPNKKYIELYNRTDYDINLKNWKIFYGSSGISRIAADTLYKKSYAVLCTTTAVNDFKPFGKTISAVYFPTLPHSGQCLQLIDPENNLISQIEYLPNWHDNETTANGGVSIEKIDFDNLSELKTNWKSSADEQGGTPGKINSVFGKNKDNEPPILTNWEITDKHTLTLTFNEPIDLPIAENTEIYFADKDLGKPQKSTATFNKIELVFENKIVENKIYKLTINNDFCDLAGNCLKNFELNFGLMQPPKHGDIVINEILFNPKDDGVDFVEIYNRSQNNFDLKNIFISTRNKSDELQTICRISQTNKFLMPKQFAVLSTNPEIIKQHYFVENPEAMVEMQKFPQYPNTGGNVVLLDSSTNIIDEFIYSDKMHFKFINNPKGVSLERVNYDTETNNAKNWNSASSFCGYATPTYKNSQKQSESENSGFEITEKTFCPNCNGFNNELTISYKMKEPGYVANIKVFDARGRFVAEIANNALLGSEGKIKWNGMNDKNQKFHSGVYIIYIECFNLQGNVSHYKKTCVIADRT